MSSGRIAARVAVLATTSALIVALALVATAPPSAATFPVGPMGLHLKVTETLLVDGVPTDLGPMSGTAHGTIDGTGHFAFPAGSIDFDPVTLNLAGDPATFRVVPSANWTGSVDPSAGNILLSGASNLLLSIPSLGVVDCPLGPSTWKLFGNGYRSTTGKALVSDPAFVIPALDGSQANCANRDASINTELGLPGNGSVRAALTFAPVVGFDPPPTTNPPTTTTVVSPPLTTGLDVAPVELPRTGSSTAPLALIGGTFVLSGLALLVRRRAA